MLFLRYAGLHGVQAAVQVYTDKLLFSVKPSTVRKFRQLYGESGPENLTFIQLSESSSTTIDLLHSSLDVLNPGPNSASYNAPYLPCDSGQVFSTNNYKSEPSNTSSDNKPSDDSKEIVKKVTVKKEPSKMSRGRYVQYSDELR